MDRPHRAPEAGGPYAGLRHAAAGGFTSTRRLSRRVAMSQDLEPSSKPADVKPLAEAPPEEVQRAQAERLLRAWKIPTGWRYWSAVNNSEVGLWYTAMTFFFLLFGGVLALLMRIQLAVPDNDFLPAELYNQAFTVHGSV